MTYLGSRTSPPAVLDHQSRNPYGEGLWSIEFTPAILAISSASVEVYHMSVRGPTGSSMDVYVNQTFYDTTVRGDINSWDANNALFLRGGESLIFYWNSSATPAPKVSIWLRTPQ